VTTIPAANDPSHPLTFGEVERRCATERSQRHVMLTPELPL